MPTIELNEAELAATIEALRRFIDEDPFPRAPHLDALRGALVKLEKTSRHQTQDGKSR
jgi:hypothetical protein